MERLEGSHSMPVTWAELDADYTLKLPTLFHPCLDTLTAAITGAFDLFGMGRRGIAPITSYVEIQAGGTPIALGRPLEMRYRVELYRATLAGAGGQPPRERLLLEQRVALHAFRRAGGATDLGHDDGSGEAVEAGAFRLIQVLTRPFAPPGQRQVSEVPEELSTLAERPYDGTPPDTDRLWEPPPGLREETPAGVLPLGRVWGRGHTDINHHVTVTEYLRLCETAHVALAHAAGLPLAGHRTSRICCLFRRPSFAGDGCAVQGRFLRGRFADGAEGTALLGGIHRQGADGALEPEPSVVARLEAALESDETPGVTAPQQP